VILREVADAGTAAGGDGPLVRGLAAGEEPEEGGLPGPVRPDEPDTLAGPQVERQAGEQRAGAVTLGQPPGRQQDAHAALAAGVGGARDCPDPTILSAAGTIRVGPVSEVLCRRFTSTQTPAR